MHAVAARNIRRRHRRVGELEDRALINLPFPIPTIPILGDILKPLAPLLTPIIDGEHPATTTTSAQHTTTHTTSPAATQAPAPSPTTAAPNPPSPSNSTSSGSDPSGGSGGGNTGSGSGSSNGGGGNGSGSGGSSNAAGNDTATSAVGSNPTASPSGVASNPPGTDAAAPGTHVTAGSPGSNSQQGSDGTNSGSGATGSNGSTSLGVVVNANGAAFVSGTNSALLAGETANFGSTTISANGAQVTGTGTDVAAGRNTGSPSGSNAGSTTSSTTNADPSSQTNANAAATHHGMSMGIIVAICVIVGLISLLLLLFCCRRRAVAARLRRRKTWFTAGAYAGNEKYRDGGSPGRNSARSSFATHFDRGQLVTPAPQLDFSVSGDEISQVWPSNMSGSISVPAASHTVESAPSPTMRAASDRSSIGSLGSADGRTSQTSQYLALPAAAATEASPYGLDFPSPFSVRPFSPSETFSFPRPPQDDTHSRASGVVSGSVLGGGSVLSGSLSSAAFYTAEDHPPADVEPSENPFLDFTEVAARPPSTSTEASSPSKHFAPTETIRRPFLPTMEDEMAVTPGQDVHILRRFDDGWALAEVLATGRQGLIPIDCLRAVEEDLPAFLAKKRLSSYDYSARARRGSRRASAFSGVSSSVGMAV
ncbi:hypothetical protein C8Q79DRAFT_558969 [Trametes meyenii]|nr:hypothetical protein C8Q79DRAFT_558969 [Trametes meyenii]